MSLSLLSALPYHHVGYLGIYIIHHQFLSSLFSLLYSLSCHNFFSFQCSNSIFQIPSLYLHWMSVPSVLGSQCNQISFSSFPKSLQAFTHLSTKNNGIMHKTNTKGYRGRQTIGQKRSIEFPLFGSFWYNIVFFQSNHWSNLFSRFRILDNCSAILSYIEQSFFDQTLCTPF